MTLPGYIRATVLMGFSGVVESSGGNAAALLSQAGIDPKALTEPDGLISHVQLANLYEIVARDLGRPSFGIELTLAAPKHFPALGSMAMLGQFVSTYGEWIDLALKYCRYYSNAFSMPLRKDEKTGLVAMRYQVSSMAYPARQLTECTMANAVQLSRNVADREDLTPVVVRFQHAKPRELSRHLELFRCPFEFGAEHNEVVFEPGLLELPTAGHLKIFKPILGLYIKSRIATMPIYDQSMATTIELAVASILGTGKCNIEFVSASLGLTTKKLQRLLASENTSFSDILDKVRAKTGRKLLAESSAPVADIAEMLDYSTTAPFTQAFKRWTGQSPLEFRKSERAAANDSGPTSRRPVA